MVGAAGKLYSGSEKLGSDIWRTSDGLTWEQVGTCGLGNPASIMLDLAVFKNRLYALSFDSGDTGMEVWVYGDKLFLQAVDYKAGSPGSQIRESADGER